jgi:alkylation response protein AidB-like acyl-CoA dehydrogenase
VRKLDFSFSPEQEMLRESARRFLNAECPPSFVRRMMADDTALDAAFWQRLVEMGWLAMVVPEQYGGQGAGFLDLTVVLEEAGRALMPGPFLTATTLGVSLLAESQDKTRKLSLLREAAAGKLIGTLAFAEAAGRYDAAGVQMRAEKRGNRYLLSGEKMFVPDAHLAHGLVVAARTATAENDAGHGVTLFWLDAGTPGVRITQLKTVDMTRRLCRVIFDQVEVEPSQILGQENGGWSLARRAMDLVTAGLCAELVGTAQKALDLAVEYAKVRTQFGKPIGAFQAVKHKCVDMMVALENARSLAYYACWAVDQRAPEAPRAVALAKAQVSDMAKYVTSEAIQVHGGIGFTWENDMHLFYRRAIAGEAAFGNAAFHRESVARTLAP